MKHAMRFVVSSLLLAAGAGECLAAPQKSFRAEFTRAQQQMQRRQHAQVPKMCDAMLKTFKEPHQVKEIRLLKNEALMLMEKYTEILADLAKLQKEFEADKDVQTRALLMIGQALHGQKKFDEAIASYQKLAKDYADYADRAGEALLRVGEILCKDKQKPTEGLAVYAAVEKQFAAQPKVAAEGARRAAAILETVTKDPVKAAAMNESLAVKYAAVHNEASQSTYFNKAVDLLRGAGKMTEAVAVADKAEKALKSITYKVAFALRKADLLMELKKSPEARVECERIICTYPTDQNTCQTAQTKVVEAYRSESKFAESLGAARALYDVAGTDQHIRAAAGVLAAAFRSVDGNLGRANEFLAYQRFGPLGPDGKPNTPDDLKVNPLAPVKYPVDPARDKRFQAAVTAQPKTYQGYRAMGFLYGYWGKPKECAQHFYLAFKSCPEASVPAAAGELVLMGMKAHTASFAGLSKIFEFISYGPKGKDGKQKIADPFVGL